MTRIRSAVLGALCLGIWAASIPAAGSLLSDQLPPDWKSTAPAAEYAGSQLYDYIDGEADLYVNAGFVTLKARRYVSAHGGTREIEVNIYDQGKPLQAFGLFRQVRDPARPVSSVGAEACSGPSLVQFWKGRFFGEIIDRSSPALAAGEFQVLARALAAQVPGDSGLPREFSRLPVAGKIPGGELFTLKSFLSRRALANVLSAPYQTPAGICTLFVLIEVPAKDAGVATQALSGIKNISFQAAGSSIIGVKGNVPELMRQELLREAKKVNP
jgi:hypothetical protein